MRFQKDWNKIVQFMIYCGKAPDGFSTTESFVELCCLTPKFQCDGIVECKNDDDRSDEDNCNGCRNSLGFCDGTLTCLDKKCKGKCMDGLTDCKYGGNAIIQCAPRYFTDIFAGVDCGEWARGAANLPAMFE